MRHARTSGWFNAAGKRKIPHLIVVSHGLSISQARPAIVLVAAPALVTSQARPALL